MLTRLLFLFVSFFPVEAFAEPESPVRLYGSLEVGVGRISVDQDSSFEQEKEVSSLSAAGITGGLLLFDRVLLEFTAHNSGSVSIFGEDSYEIKQRQIMLGYAFQATPNTRWIPKVGYGRWDIDFEEGPLFNPGPEERFNLEDGEDWVVGGEFERSVSDLFSWGFSLNYTETDFGSALQTRFVAKLKTL